ncbi:MAG: acetyltransferase [Gammaproteobacteria bacterium]|nr:acetyltransferase [Gammaproteobacteria bacterium]
MQKIILIGNNISADILHQYLLRDNRYQVVAFAVDSDYLQEPIKMGLPVVDINNLTTAYSSDTHKVIMAIGYSQLNQTRQELFNRVAAMGFAAETYVHPDASIFNGGEMSGGIGEGSVIMPQTIVEPFAVVGKNSVIWGNCLIGHHAVVGDNCWLASGTVLAGSAAIGNNTFLGVNVTVSQHVKIAGRNIIGSATAIHKDTRENEVYLSRHSEKHRFTADDYAQHLLK